MALWRLSIACTRHDADALARAEELPDGILALAAEESDAGWTLVGWTADVPASAVRTRFAALAPATRAPPIVARETPADWVSRSQAGMPPVHAGRFHLHDGDHPGRARPGQLRLRIDAGLAFGTGQHATTRGCLEALSRLARARRPGSVLDLGTGTGVLAIAAARLWLRADVRAGDVDRRAARIARANARLNRLPHGRLRPVKAAGLLHPQLLSGAPYALVIANILAGPLVALAPTIAHAVSPGGRLILAGLLAGQRQRVLAAYRNRGFRLIDRGRGEWPVLHLARRGPAPKLVPRGAAPKLVPRGPAPVGGRGPGPLFRAASRGTAGRTRLPDEA